ncbi:MAG: phospho-N-acetylmuramoyl-pentapeptide-transferase [Armatimonadetes bacterium]|nr:phospho-N-acetylmuramoyl-pentapeptide-transferase [Armatimonadota bacterium]CUU38593.1 Phospho-N-acetylmuramoyl-pentapeptide-transferase [Armatimonadetes bacterium DC]
MTMEALTASLIALILGKPMIGWLAKLNIRQTIYSYAPETHRPKEGTPTMGGFIILCGVLGGLLAYALQQETQYLLPSMLAILTGAFLFALIGLVDDHLIRRWTGQRGLEWKTKLVLQGAVGAFSLWLMAQVPPQLQSAPPTPPSADGHLLWWGLGLLWLVGWVNALNLTDGLDGLAGGLSVIAFGTLSVMAREVSVAALGGVWAGAALGYLWWNTHPAKVFMGDTGSMALGAAFGLLTWREWMLNPTLSHAAIWVLLGGVFAVEVLTVIIQLSAVKTLRRRIFKATPIHHHFELLGWREPEIVVRFWIAGALCALGAFLLWGGAHVNR